MEIVVLASGVGICLSALSSLSCVDRRGDRDFGGQVTVDLRPGEKVEGVSWKSQDLWILTREARPGEKHETYRFKEHSVLGLFEGQVTIRER